MGKTAQPRVTDTVGDITTERKDFTLLCLYRLNNVLQNQFN